MKEGYTNIENKIIMTEKMTGYEKIVLIIMLMHSMGKKECYPGRETLARIAGHDIKTIDIAIKGLIKKKYINKFSSKGKQNIYKINF